MSDLRSFHVCIASLSGKRSCWDLDWLFKASQNHQALSCKYNLIFLTRLNSVGDWVKLHSGGSDVISCARLGGFRVECVSSSINSPTSGGSGGIFGHLKTTVKTHPKKSQDDYLPATNYFRFFCV